MNSDLLRVCALVATATIPCVICAAAPAPTNEQLAKKIGVNAVLSANSDLAVEKRIRDGKVDEAIEIITADCLRLLPLLREYDIEIASEPRVRELRDRIVKSLQTHWLREPPMYLDEQSAEYLERTCATIPGCPAGRVHPLKKPALPPAE